MILKNGKHLFFSSLRDNVLPQFSTFIQRPSNIHYRSLSDFHFSLRYSCTAKLLPTLILLCFSWSCKPKCIGAVYINWWRFTLMLSAHDHISKSNKRQGVCNELQHFFPRRYHYHTMNAMSSHHIAFQVICILSRNIWTYPTKNWLFQNFVCNILRLSILSTFSQT